MCEFRLIPVDCITYFAVFVLDAIMWILAKNRFAPIWVEMLNVAMLILGLESIKSYTASFINIDLFNTGGCLTFKLM